MVFGWYRWTIHDEKIIIAYTIRQCYSLSVYSVLMYSIPATLNDLIIQLSMLCEPKVCSRWRADQMPTQPTIKIYFFPKSNQNIERKKVSQFVIFDIKQCDSNRLAELFFTLMPFLCILLSFAFVFLFHLYVYHSFKKWHWIE